MTYIRIATTNLSLMDEQAQESLRMLYKETRLSIASRHNMCRFLIMPCNIPLPNDRTHGGNDLEAQA